MRSESRQTSGTRSTPSVGPLGQPNQPLECSSGAERGSAQFKLAQAEAELGARRRELEGREAEARQAEQRAAELAEQSATQEARQRDLDAREDALSAQEVRVCKQENKMGLTEFCLQSDSQMRFHMMRALRFDVKAVTTRVNLFPVPGELFASNRRWRSQVCEHSMSRKLCSC